MTSSSAASLRMTIGIVLLAPSATQAQVGSPAGPVPVERLQARRSALLAKLGNGVAIIPSAEVRSIEGDYPQDSDYRENNDFFYLTGLEAPGSYLVLLARKFGRDEAILYLPARDSATEKWTGPRLGPGSEATRLTGITDVRAATRAADEVPDLVNGSGSPARALGGALYLRRNQQREGSSFIRGLVFGDKKRGTPVRVEDLDGKIGVLRQVKDEDEISRLRRAISITTDALKEAMGAARPGMWEYELEARIEYGFRRRGAERIGFPSIIGSGPNGVTLHYDKNRRQVQAGDLVVQDVGAEFGYYSADVTRTIPITGQFTPRQRALYDLVLATQQTAIDAVRPGTDLATLNRIARDYLREHSGDLCGSASCVPYFTHGLSHWLGMDVHDGGSLGARLRPGMVLTVEPGIYLPAESLGIRIEDDVLVTPGGHEILSQGAPRTSTEIEKAMGQRLP
jgi:Xaa-Pro aminopeptidase